MRVLGIDPGTHRIGWAIIEGDVTEQQALHYGCIELEPHTSSTIYLKTLHIELNKILEEFKPDKAGVEKIFFQNNKKTAITVAQSRGVILLALAEQNIPCIELSPNTIKSAVAGNGKATKQQVGTMVKILLNMKDSPLLDDTSDALATAITTITMGETNDI